MKPPMRYLFTIHPDDLVIGLDLDQYFTDYSPDLYESTKTLSYERRTLRRIKRRVSSSHKDHQWRVKRYLLNPNPEFSQ